MMASSSADGAYVQLPSAELLAIIALEAHRAGAFVVGEDLGTVQPEVRSALAASAMLGTKVWWFETDVGGWAEPNLATVTTHDLPTIAGVLAGTDGTPEMRAALVELSAGAPGNAQDATVAAVAVHDEIARSAARLVMATLDDLAGSTERPNHPGTLDGQHPNWCLRMAADPATILGSPQGSAIIAALSRARGGTRTHTPFRTTDFESVASAIPPLGRVTPRS
jgi:4-alpha-glucanotransferase